MFTIHPSRRRFFGIAVLVALTLLVPAAVTAEEEVAALVPVAAPSVDDTSADAAHGTRALAAEHALQSGNMGSMQEERLRAIVASGPSPDATSGCGSVEASHAANVPLAGPATSTTTEQTRVFAAQQALRSPDLGSLQEDALTAVVAASSAEAES